MKFDVDCKAPRSHARLLDKLCGHFIEDRITTKPAFITEHPQVPPGVFSTMFYGVLGSADTSLCLLLTATNE